MDITDGDVTDLSIVEKFSQFECQRSGEGVQIIMGMLPTAEIHEALVAVVAGRKNEERALAAGRDEIAIGKIVKALFPAWGIRIIRPQFKHINQWQEIV